MEKADSSWLNWLLLILNSENFETVVLLMSYTMNIVSVAVLVLLSVLRLSAPYGRYSSSNWGPPVNPKVAWVVQELPSLLVPLFLVLYSNHYKSINIILLSLYMLHYIQRALIYPFLIQGGKPTPVFPFLMAFVFCAYNGLLQSLSLLHVDIYPDDWLSRPRTMCGIGLFFTGMFINIHSDHILRNLRKPGEVGYKIPHGGMFEFVSGANFFGEILEWSGFAIACHSVPAVSFAIFTALNIGPRALQHHSWYKKKFENYPQNRKALIPFIL